MESLVRELNSPSNQSSADRIKEIQRQIQQFQRDRSAWQLGLDFVQHEDSLIRFYGALTLTIKINADWDNDKLGTDESMKEHLLQELVSNYVRLCLVPDAQFVLQKLCSTLVALFQRADSGWGLPLRHILACMAHGHFIRPKSIPSIAEIISIPAPLSHMRLKGALLLATTIAEDIKPHQGPESTRSVLLSSLWAQLIV